MLNYMYALLESESRLAAAALGLDPGIGFLHVDTDARDSLACDLMEPVRPQVDAYLLNWITRQHLRREWFFEQCDGVCRLMASFAVRLSESSSTWRSAVAPFAERVCRELWATVRKPARQMLLPTRLTQAHRREAKGVPTASTTLEDTRAASWYWSYSGVLKRGRRCQQPTQAHSLRPGFRPSQLSAGKPPFHCCQRGSTEEMWLYSFVDNYPILAI